VAALRLAGEARGERPEGSVIAILRDGGRLRGTLTPRPGPALGMKLDVGPVVALDPAGLSALEFKAAGLVYLSELEPVAYEHVPFLEGGTRLPLLRDRARDGGTMQANGRAVRRGLALPYGSKTTFAVPEGARALHGVACMPPRTSPRLLAPAATVTILSGETVLWASPSLTAGADPSPFSIDLPAGASRVEIVVRLKSPPPVGHDVWLAGAHFR
jgi:hypothetical protein